MCDDQPLLPILDIWRSESFCQAFVRKYFQSLIHKKKKRQTTKEKTNNNKTKTPFLFCINFDTSALILCLHNGANIAESWW